MDTAVRGIHDAVASGLKESDLRASRLAADGQTCSISMCQARQLVGDWLGQAGRKGELADPFPSSAGQLGDSEARTTGAGRAMRAEVSIRHTMHASPDSS